MVEPCCGWLAASPWMSNLKIIKETRREERLHGFKLNSIILWHVSCSSVSSVWYFYTYRYCRQHHRGHLEPAAYYIYSFTVPMLHSHMLYCIAAYAASTVTVCPSDIELCDLHDCCISADMDSKEGREEEKEEMGWLGGKEDWGENESKGEKTGKEVRGEGEQWAYGLEIWIMVHSFKQA